jgi:uncharacterized protein
VVSNTEDALRLPQGYSNSVVVRWGDPIMPDGPALTLADVCNHEYTTEP